MKTAIAVAVLLIGGSMASAAQAAPSAETAKRCMHYSYLLYPYKRPGSVRGSGERGAYFWDCMARDGNVPEPAVAKP